MLQSGHADYCEFANSHEPFEFLKKNDSPYLFKKRLQTFPKTLDFLPKVTSGISEGDLDFLSRYFSYLVKNKVIKKKLKLIINQIFRNYNAKSSTWPPMDGVFSAKRRPTTCFARTMSAKFRNGEEIRDL